jgi:lysophospholipase L1-like esterase
VAEPGYEDPHGASIVDPDGVRPAISFLQVPEVKTTKNRMHIDIRVAGEQPGDMADREQRIRAKAAELATAGATTVREQFYGELLGHVVMLDPEGPGRGGASLLARNRDDDFPTWRGRDLSAVHPGLRFELLAADGGTTATVLDVQLPRLARMAVRPQLVTLTVGGNDLLGAYGDTEAARRVVDTVGHRLDEILRTLEQHTAPGARLVVGTVYDPSDGTGDAEALGLPPWPDAVTVVGELNSAIRQVAATHAATVADVHAAFLGHGLRAGDPRQPDPRPAARDLWYCSLIEPNAWGASAVRAAFWHALRASD